MIEILYRRKLIRDLLNQYSSKQWEVIIPLIVEIGIVNLMNNNFNITGLTIEDYKIILGN
jgi:hypothetical protein